MNLDSIKEVRQEILNYFQLSLVGLTLVKNDINLKRVDELERKFKNALHKYFKDFGIII